MRHSLPLALLLAATLPALAAPEKRLTDFQLEDQNQKTRAYKFPKSKVTVMTVADHKGSDELEPWIQALHDRYGKTIDIDGIADVSIIPKPFQPMFRREFRKRLKYSVMLDWSGEVVEQFDYEKGVANVFVISRSGVVKMRITGPATDEGLRALFKEIDRTMKGDQ